MPLRIDDAIVRVQVDADSVQQRLDAIREAERESVRAADKEARENLKKASEEESKKQEKKAQKDTRKGSGLATAGKVGLAVGAASLVVDKIAPFVQGISDMFVNGVLSEKVANTVNGIVDGAVSAVQSGTDAVKVETKAGFEAIKPTFDVLMASEILGKHASSEKALEFWNRERQWISFQNRMRLNGERAYLRNSGQAIGRIINRGVLGR